MTSSSSSRKRLHDLLTTYYIPNDEHFLETARAGSSTTTRHGDTAVEQEEQENVVLLDVETPKLVAKPRVTLLHDDAVQVLRRLQKTSSEVLRSACHDYLLQRWSHTTRDSEVELVEHVLLHPNQRPCYFAMQCNRLEIEDVGRLILKSLLSEPRKSGQCQARFSIKTVIEMPFKVLYETLETLAVENDGFQVTDAVVNATLVENDVTRRLRTTDCKEYGYLESTLEARGSLMVSRASLTCSIRGRRHVQLRLVYSNNTNGDDESGRDRRIELEQTVKLVNRRLLIQERNELKMESGLENELAALGDHVPPFEDLVEFLKTR